MLIIWKFPKGITGCTKCPCGSNVWDHWPNP